MTKLEQILERLMRELERYKDPTQLNGTDYYRLPVNKLEHIITEVWNEAIKECEGCVPGEMEGNDDEYDYRDMGRVSGHNLCREQTLQAIAKLKI